MWWTHSLGFRLRAHLLRVAGGDHGGHATQRRHKREDATGATMLTVHTSFPRAGLYGVWMQIQRKKHVITMPFAVKVIE